MGGRRSYTRARGYRRIRGAFTQDDADLCNRGLLFGGGWSIDNPSPRLDTPPLSLSLQGMATVGGTQGQRERERTEIAKLPQQRA